MAVDLCFCYNRNLNLNVIKKWKNSLFISFTVEKETLYTQKHGGKNQCTILILEVVCQFDFPKIPPPGQSGLKLFHWNKSMCLATDTTNEPSNKTTKGPEWPAGSQSNRCFLKNRQTYRQMWQCLHQNITSEWHHPISSHSHTCNKCLDCVYICGACCLRCEHWGSNSNVSSLAKKERGAGDAKYSTTQGEKQWRRKVLKKVWSGWLVEKKRGGGPAESEQMEKQTGEWLSTASEREREREECLTHFMSLCCS